MTNIILNRREQFVALAFAVAGYMAVWLPWKLALNAGILEGSAADNLIDGLQMISLPLMLILGIAGGALFPKRFWIGGLFAWSLFPVMAIFEMILGSTSHSIWPIEFMLYGVGAGVLIVAGWFTSFVVTTIKSMMSSRD
ncbi:hypothetical protein HQ496_11885 [bacterium]|nr:hypothetical protein [bacterium]